MGIDSGKLIMGIMGLLIIGDSLNCWYTKIPKSQGLLAFLLLSLRLTFGQETYLGGPLKRRTEPGGGSGMFEGRTPFWRYWLCICRSQASKCLPFPSFHFDRMNCIWNKNYPSNISNCWFFCSSRKEIQEKTMTWTFQKLYPNQDPTHR